MSKIIEHEKSGITIKIRQHGHRRYIITDYTTGERVRHVRSTLSEAKAKADDLCTLLANGKAQDRALLSDDELKFEFRRAREVLQPTGVKLLRAAQLVVDCCALIPMDEILDACRHWKNNRPDKRLTPTPAKEAATEFIGSQENKLTKAWLQSVRSYLNRFGDEFKARPMHEITTGDLQAMVEKQSWSPKTHNDFRSAVNLLYKFAASGNRNWVARNYNPATDLEKRKIKGGDIGIFEPWEARQMLERLEPEHHGLLPFMSLWLFSGLRKEEISRLSWMQVHSALKTGHVDILAKQAKTGVARSVPLLPNCRAWLTYWEGKYGKQESGALLPLKWNTTTALAKLPREVERITGIVWRDNAPRHSYATFRSKILGNTVTVGDEMGNSAQKVERHYRRKSVMAETAAEWFNVLPPQPAENVVTLSQSI